MDMKVYLAMASQARKVGRRIPGAGTGAIRYEGGGGLMDASEFPGSRERKGESSKVEKLSSWHESGRVDVRRSSSLIGREL